MARFRKYVLWSAAVLVAVLLGFLVAIKLLVTPQRVRAVLIPLAEKNLGKKVELESIEVSLFSGIRLEKLRVLESQSGDPVLIMERAVLKYRFWPLLLKNIVVDEIELVSPNVTLHRDEQGSIRIDKPGSSDQEEVDAPPQPEVNANGPAEGGARLRFLVSQLAIRDGQVVMLDHRLNPQVPFRYQVDHLQLKASSLALDRRFPLEMSGRLADATFRLSGQADPMVPGGDFRIELERLDLAALSPYFKDSLPGTLNRGFLDLDLDLSVASGVVRARGTLDLAELALSLERFPDVPVKDAAFGLTFDTTFERGAGSLQVNSLQLRYNALPLKASGVVRFPEAGPHLELAVALDKLLLRDAIDSLPEPLVSGLAGYDPAGELTADVQLNGPLSAPAGLLQRAELQLNGVQFNLAGQRPALSGPLVFADGRMVAERVELVAGDNRAELSLTADRIFQPPVEVALTLSADRFDLVPPAKPESGAMPGAQSEPGTELAAEAGPFDLPVTASLAVRIAHSRVRQLMLDDLEFSGRLEGNVFQLDRLSCALLGGTLQGSGRVDLRRKGLVYSADIKGERIKATALADAYASDYASALQGDLGIAAEFKGRGTVWETARESLSGEGDFAVDGLVVSNAPLVDELSIFLALRELKQLTFDRGAGHFQVKQGRVQVEADFSSSKAQFRPKGAIGFDGTIDLVMPTRLSPQLAKDFGRLEGVGTLLKDQDGWTELPLKVGGQLVKPKFSLDTRQIKKQARQKGVEKLEKKLLDKIAPEVGDAKGREDGRQLLEEALKGLLRR